MWFWIALIVGAGIIWMAWQFNKKNIQIRWYEWVLGVLGILLILLTIRDVMDAQAEQVTKAPGMMLLVTGLPALVILALTWQLIVRHPKVKA